MCLVVHVLNDIGFVSYLFGFTVHQLVWFYGAPTCLVLRCTNTIQVIRCQSRKEGFWLSWVSPT
jgi:hypothetical protein